MNDYFRHLIDRTTNQTPSVRPLLPSLFESPDFHASSDLEVEIIDPPRGKTAKVPAIRSVLPSLDESQDFHAFTATDEPADETIPDLREKTERENTVPVLPEKKSNLPSPAGYGKQLSADIRDKEALPEKLILSNVSENHKEDTDDKVSPSLHTQAAGTFSSGAVNPVFRKTAFKNVAPTAPLPDNQLSDVLDSGANQKTDRPLPMADKAVKIARRVSPMESASVLHAMATGSKQAYVIPAGSGKQPGIRPLIKVETGPQLSPDFPAQRVQPEKTIKVTIGRIEVRAVMPQAPLSLPQMDRKETQPKISLEDYLQKQRGGSR